MEGKYNLREITPNEMKCSPFPGCPGIYVVEEVTPENEKCIANACPSVYEITSSDEKCLVGSCPSVFETKDAKCGFRACPHIEEYENKYLIIGKIEDAKDFGLEKKVADDEMLISIPKGIIDGMKK